MSAKTLFLGISSASSSYVWLQACVTSLSYTCGVHADYLIHKHMRLIVLMLVSNGRFFERCFCGRRLSHRRDFPAFFERRYERKYFSSYQDRIRDLWHDRSILSTMSRSRSSRHSNKNKSIG